LQYFLATKTNDPMELNSIKALLIAMLLVVSVASSQDIDINGSITQTFVKTTGNQDDWSSLSNTKEGSFEFSEILLGISSQLNEKCRAGAQLISRDFGSLGNFETQLDWGYGDYRFDEKFGLRVGKMKLPRGLYNETRDVDGSRTNILLDQGMYPEDWRSFITSFQGLGFYGTFEDLKGPWGSLDYQIYAGTVNIPDDFFFVRDLKNNIDKDLGGLDTKSLMGFQLGYSPSFLDGLKLNATYVSWEGKSDMYLYNQAVNGGNVFNTINSTSLNEGRIDSAMMLGYDSYELGFEYFWKNYTFFGELQNTYTRVKYAKGVQDAQAAYAALSDNDKANPLNQLVVILPIAIDPVDTFAYKLGFNYQWNSAFQTRISYSNFKRNKDIPDCEHRSTLSLRYDINYNMIAKLEYTDYYSDSKTVSDDHYGIFLARLGFSF
jgi:hypothetical protein